MSEILNEISSALQRGKSKIVKQLVPQALGEAFLHSRFSTRLFLQE